MTYIFMNCILFKWKLYLFLDLKKKKKKGEWGGLQSSPGQVRDLNERCKNSESSPIIREVATSRARFGLKTTSPTNLAWLGSKIYNHCRQDLNGSSTALLFRVFSQITSGDVIDNRYGQTDRANAVYPTDF